MEELLEEVVIDSSEEELPSDVRQGKYMTFRVGKNVYGIELKYVNEIIQMQPIAPIPEVEHYIKGLVNLRGKIIPVIDVADRFGLEKFEYNDRTCIIVIEVKGVEVGLVIENIAEVVSIEENEILPPPNKAHGGLQDKFIHGISQMEDGLKLLLDPVKLLSDDALNFVDKAEEDDEE